MDILYVFFETRRLDNPDIVVVNVANDNMFRRTVVTRRWCMGEVAESKAFT